MFETPCYFEPTFLILGNLIFEEMTGLVITGGSQAFEYGHPPGLG